MDILWTPWRFRYVSEGVKTGECVFCEKSAADPKLDRENLILHRGQRNLIILNLFPYTTGHTMIAPYTHVATLAELDAETLQEMMTLAQKIETALGRTYHPEGFNLGMNLGRCAGAGVADHVHLHFLPRWTGDTSFMTTTSETRVQPEDLAVTYDKLARFFRTEKRSK
jgi:ATP adenylyltransferase